MSTRTEAPPVSSTGDSSKTGSANAEDHTLNSPQQQQQPQHNQQEVTDSEEAAVMARKIRKAKQHKKWNRRLKIFFCCLGYKRNKVITTEVKFLIIDC